jgi:transposase
MTSLPKRKFTAEFRSQAVKLLREGGVPQVEAARQLGISEQTLASWMKQARRGNVALFAAGGVSPAQQEITRLKRELAEVKMEAGILRKAMAYFAKGSR